MPTSSFNKSVVITEPEAIDRLVDSLLRDEPRKIDTKWLTPENAERGRRLLKRIFNGNDNVLPAALKKKLDYYMELNYKIELVRDEEEESGYIATYPDLKGCTAHGEDLIDTILNLEDAKWEWLIAALQDGMEIPEPEPKPEEKHEKNK